ncbi:cytochrome P450 [Glomus cerebriforme]|uniref:Cytochrome P450 n=1 Tax=Glomus cerebriforme TaxID=658196 RepID=A0A397TG91_9GLOM|nr:cytochrome P450 [Glomus cerebriforme]
MTILNIIYNLTKIISTLIVVYIIKFYFSWYTRENPIPGPIPLPLIGNLHQIGKDMEKGALKLQKQYGDIFEVLLGSTRAIFISRADLVEKIYSPALKNNAFAHRTSPNSGLDELGLSKSGITFNMDLEAWKFNRRILGHTVMSPKFLKENVNFINQICDELENYWLQLGPETIHNFSNWTSCFATDITLTATTGTKSYATAFYYNSLSNSVKVEIPNSIINEFLKFMDSIYMFISSIMFFFNIPSIIRHHFPIIKSLQKKHEINNEWLNIELEKIISKRKQEIENIPLDQSINYNVLNLLIITNTERNPDKISGIDHTRSITDIEIRNTLKEIFSAGLDTTRNASCFILYYILKYPDVKDKLIKEYESVYGDLGKKLNITRESLDKLIYTEAVINETTRIQPLVSVLMRSASFDTEIGGYKIKKGTDVFTNFIGIHTHKAHWDEPENFNPDRFLKDNNNHNNIIKNSHLNFGGGIRICPGRHWAMDNIKILFVRLLTKFEISLVNPDNPLKIEFDIVRHCDELEIYIKEKKTIS